MTAALFHPRGYTEMQARTIHERDMPLCFVFFKYWESSISNLKFLSFAGKLFIFQLIMAVNGVFCQCWLIVSMNERWTQKIHLSYFSYVLVWDLSVCAGKPWPRAFFVSNLSISGFSFFRTAQPFLSLWIPNIPPFISVGPNFFAKLRVSSNTRGFQN